MGGGGGGNSGKISYPAYLQDWHKELLYNGTLPTLAAGEDLHARAFDATNGIFGSSNNPYVGVSAYDPNLILNDLTLELAEAESMLDKFYLNDKMSTLDLTHRESMLVDLGQAYNRVGSVLASSNAVIGTVFPNALAILEQGHAARLKEQRAKFDMEATTNKLRVVQLKLDVTRSKIAAFMDQVRLDTELNVEEVMWDTNGFLRLLSAMGTISGVAASTSRSGNPGMASSVLGSMATGASIGMTGGGPIGSAIGAGVGGLLGLFGSIF